MIIREYEEADLEAIKALHRASGFDYALPDFSGTRFFSRRVVSGAGGIGMAAFLELTAQSYLVCNPKWRTPAWRMEALRQLHTVCHSDAAKAGVSEVNAFLPPEVSKKFGNRLKRMGWKFYDGEEWKCFSYEV